MKAYVINQDQLKQYIVVSVIALIFSFSFGYILGGMEQEQAQAAADKAPEKNKMESDSKSLTDKAEPVAAAQPAKKSTDKPEANKKSDTKKQTKKAEVKKEAAKKQAKAARPDSKKQVAKKAPVKKPEAKKVAASKKVAESKKTVKPKEKPKAVSSAKSKDKTPVVAKSTPKPDVESTKADLASTASRKTEQVNDLEKSKRLYSIQAGMFASKNNAESFIKKLAEENFVAYVTDFVSTSGAVKYNVRVGYFDEREKAREKLKEYQKFFSTPAYVVISQ